MHRPAAAASASHTTPRHPGLLQHPKRVQLAGRLDDPRQHQVPEHLITASGPAQAQHVIARTRASSKTPIRDAVIGSGPQRSSSRARSRTCSPGQGSVSPPAAATGSPAPRMTGHYSP